MKKLFILIILCAAAYFYFNYTNEAEAQVVGFPFGGKVLTVTPCTNGLLVTLGPPTPMRLLYPWGALSYKYGPPRTPGQWLLGKAFPGGVCNVGLFVNIPTAGTIIFHGSSII